MSRARLETINGKHWLTFTPNCMTFPTQLPVITSGNRDQAGAWSWNGDLEKPTLMPSVRTKYPNDRNEMVTIHYWLTDGICQCLSDCTDGNAGRTVELTELQP